MNNLSIIAVSVSLGIVLPVNAANWVSDARGGGMGNTGVTSADYLLAPFYNPALVSVYRNSDDFGLLLPAVNINVRDQDDTLSVVDDLQDAIDRYEATNNASTLNQIDGYLDDLSNNRPLNANAGVGIAIAVPNETLSVNVFGRGYAELEASTDISNSADPETRYQQSRIDVKAFGYSEFGVALAKQFMLYDQTVAIGVSPKIQQMKTYQDSATVEDYNLDDYDESEVKKNAANLDVGAVLLMNEFRVGVAIKDLFSKTINTYDNTDSYKLDTQVTLSGSYVSDFFTAALDVDATKQKRFSGSYDDTQFIRLGVEANAWGWAQLRAGYEIDMENTIDNSVTLGLGISPGDVVSFDISVSGADEHQLGAAANLAFTF
ncbi:conjugal transfer protein TraF [Vibrio viridaestus]|uniref:Type IX secretion system membrane protein PorP/SprF n=1 Tax=Vibrio viridaestus TaxID=2487322 RepID=A0A3N9TL31_9VIBR|nr:conjugal transfer protein TraF [Vibrio viridaestus]RQW64573.1 type IX secretion system membrane protein PorP/SprF [Vibrio viridaestus]